MDTKIIVEFFYENFSENPEEITDFLCIKPDEVNNKGDLIKSAPEKLFVKESSWIIKAKDVNSMEINDYINNILDRIRPYKDNFKKLSNKYHPYLSCTLVIYGENKPVIILEPNIVQELAEYKAEIIIDPYFYDSEDD